MKTALQQKSRRARDCTLAALSALLLLLTLESLLLAPAGTPALAYGLVISLKLLPLLLLLPGLLKRRSLSGVWLALLLLPYFCLAGLSAFGTGVAGRIGLLQTLLIAVCFVCALLFTRWQRAFEAQP